MRVVWLQPWAWAGLAALAAPILIHLLARRRQRELAFPSLRFVRATQLAALKRRVIADLPLLAVRLLILAVAVAALAAPVFVSATRQQAWSARTARAIVTVPLTAVRDQGVPAIVESERATAFAAQVFSAQDGAANAMADATAWLDRQAPAARELVVVGDLREGALSAADVARVPLTTGIRFLPLMEGEPVRIAELTGIVESGGRTVARSLVATLDDDRTRVTYATAARPLADLVIVRAASGEEAMATAVRDAVLAEGVRLPRDGDRRLVIEFAGAAPAETVKTPATPWMRETLASLADSSGGERAGRLVVRIGVRATDPAAVHVLDRVVRTAWRDSLDALEPRRIPPGTLAAWSRAPSEAPLEAPPGNEGDARWLWALALALLALEWWMRRANRQAVSVAPPEREGRVA